MCGSPRLWLVFCRRIKQAIKLQTKLNNFSKNNIKMLTLNRLKFQVSKSMIYLKIKDWRDLLRFKKGEFELIYICYF